MAKNQKDPNKKHYFTTVSTDQNIPLFKKVCEENFTIHIWPEGGNEDKVEDYIFDELDEKNQQVTIKSKGLLKKFSKSKLLEKKIFAKFSNGVEQYFTHTKLELNEEGKYWISTKNTIYETIQRKDYRLDAGPQTSIKLKVSENVVLDCFDISAGGCSFIIDTEDLEHYEKGKEFTNCILRLNTEMFEIPMVRIMSHRELKEDSEIKIGAAFQEIDPKLDEKLCKAITLEAKAVEIRKILLKDKK